MTKQTQVIEEETLLDRFPALSAGYLVLLIIFSALLEVDTIATIVLTKFIAVFLLRNFTSIAEVTVDALYLFTSAVMQLIYMQWLTAAHSDGTVAGMTVAYFVGSGICKILIIHRMLTCTSNYIIEQQPTLTNATERTPTPTTPKLARISF